MKSSLVKTKKQIIFVLKNWWQRQRDLKKERGFKALDAKNICIRDYTGRAQKLTSAGLTEKQVGGFWGTIMAVENWCLYAV